MCEFLISDSIKKNTSLNKYRVSNIHFKHFIRNIHFLKLSRKVQVNTRTNILT